MIVAEKAVNASRISQNAYGQAASDWVRQSAPNILLIAAMWGMTAASWVFWLALEPIIGIGLDLGAVILALLLIFFPTRTDRINGWVKIGSEAGFAIVSFVLSLSHH